jgi:hypothetical protein
MNTKLEQIINNLTKLTEDSTVPRNIRKGAMNAKERLLKSTDPLDVRVSGAISILDDLANDPNIPSHGRTMIWSLITQLETVK